MARHSMLWLIFAWAVSGCGSEQAQQAPPNSAGGKLAPRRAEVPTQKPQPDAQRFSDAGVSDVFFDPERKKKLVGSLSKLGERVNTRGKQLGVPGLFVGVVIDGELVKSASYGFADVAQKRTVDEDTLFRIGSVTKPFTMTAILQLRDAGKLNLDAPAERYLKELSGVIYPTSDSPRISVRQMLSHTSGLPRDGGYSLQPDKDISEAQVLGALADLPLAYPPGTDYRYSNLGFSLLGLIIARVSGEPYRAYMAKHVFSPLGMASAGWEPSELDAEHLAHSYHRNDKGEFELDPGYERLGASEADGGLYVSGREFTRFLAFQLDATPPRDGADSKLLSRASRRESQVMGRQLGLSASHLSKPDGGVLEAKDSAVGLSWHGFQSCDFEHVVQHGGLVDHYGSDVMFLPEYGVGIFAFTNGAPVDLRAAVLDALKPMQASGALLPRKRVAKRAPALDTALARLLAVQNTWDEAKYLSMLGDEHKKNVKTEREKAELSGYHALHGNCSGGSISEYTGPTEARYELNCERGKLNMWLRVEVGTGLIAGFSGTSQDVPETPDSRRVAERVLSFVAQQRWQKGAYHQLFAKSFLKEESFAEFAKGHRSRHVSCSLGKALERDGENWQRFTASCKRGGELVVSIRLSDDAKVAGLFLKPKAAGPCTSR